MWKTCPWHDLIMYLAETIKQLFSLHWRHNGRDSVSNHPPHDCLLNRLFRRRSKKISKLRVTGLCVGNSPETGEFPTQMASNAKNVSTWWRHHAEISLNFADNNSGWQIRSVYRRLSIEILWGSGVHSETLWIRGWNRLFVSYMRLHFGLHARLVQKKNDKKLSSSEIIDIPRNQ